MKKKLISVSAIVLVIAMMFSLSGCIYESSKSLRPVKNVSLVLRPAANSGMPQMSLVIREHSVTISSSDLNNPYNGTYKVSDCVSTIWFEGSNFFESSTSQGTIDGVGTIKYEYARSDKLLRGTVEFNNGTTSTFITEHVF